MSLEPTVENFHAKYGAKEDALAEIIDISEAQSFVEPIPSIALHGEVRVPGASRPVEYTAKIPINLQSETVALLVPGFGAFKRTSRRFRDALADQEGVISVSWNPARRPDSKAALLEQALHPQKLHADTIEEVLNDIRRHPDSKNTEHEAVLQEGPVSLIAHSMGGLPAAEWASRNIEQTALVAYTGSIGLSESLNTELIKRSANVLLRDIVPGIIKGEYGREPVLAKRAAEYLLANPLRTAAEMVSCLRADIRAHVQYLAACGVRQTVVCLEKDDYFYWEEARDAVEHLVDSFKVISGKHTAPQRQPLYVASHLGAEIRRLV